MLEHVYIFTRQCELLHERYGEKGLMQHKDVHPWQMVTAQKKKHTGKCSEKKMCVHAQLSCARKKHAYQTPK